MAQNTYSFPSEVFDQATFTRRVQDMEIDADMLKKYEAQLIRNGIPTNAKWLKSMSKEGAFKTYIDKQCSGFLSGASFIPVATKNEIKFQYANAYESNKTAVSLAANIVNHQDYIFEEDETGTPTINVEATREVIRKSCYDSVDVGRLEKMAQAIDGIVKAVEALDATATEVGFPTTSSGIPIINPIGGFAVLFLADILNSIATSKMDVESLTLWIYGTAAKSRK